MACVQVGIIAKRAPTGEFMPATPIYKEVEVNEKGQTIQEEKAMNDISKLFAEKFKAYIDGCKTEGLKDEG